MGCQRNCINSSRIVLCPACCRLWSGFCTKGESQILLVPATMGIVVYLCELPPLQALPLVFSIVATIVHYALVMGIQPPPTPFFWHFCPHG